MPATMPAGKVATAAQWTPNKYNVTFNVSGGDRLPGDGVMSVTYGAAYGSLPTPSRSGYTFAGWFSEGGDRVVEQTAVSIPRDHTLHAVWEEIPTSQVETVFGKQDLTKEIFEKIMPSYTDAKYTILKRENCRI